jgi:hypothetical protein
MIGKIITFIIVYYLVRYVMNLFNAPKVGTSKDQNQEPFAPPPTPPKQQYNNTTSGDYIDYEEVK